MNEAADEERHVALMLIAELDATGRENAHRDAKFKVIAKSVRHYTGEQENEMLPKAKELKIDFEALRQQILDRKEEPKEDAFRQMPSMPWWERPADARMRLILAFSQEPSKERARAPHTRRLENGNKIISFSFELTEQFHG